MKFQKLGRAAVIAAAGSILLASCAANESGGGGGTSEGEGGVSGTIEATGASSQTAAQEAWVAGFLEGNGDADVIYEPTGSGVGRDNFIAGASNFVGSDRAFNEEEVAEGGFGSCVSDDLVEIPVYISPVAVIFNLDGVESLNLDAATLGGIFAGDITSWDDAAIADLNPDADLPDTNISPVHRSDASGTQETFTAYLEAVAPEAWEYEASDEWPIQGGEAAQGTSGVVDRVSSGQGTIGFADASQAGDLGTVAIEVGGEFVEFSPEAAAQLVAGAELESGRGDADLVYDVDPAAAPEGSYPIALVSYLIGCTEYEDPDVAALVQAYFSYVVSAEGQDAAAENAGSAPLSDDLREQVQGAIDLIQVEG